MDNITCVKKKIKEIIGKSSVPEDPAHSKNTLEWVLKLKPDADEALKIAALGHDIERAFEEQKVKCEDYKSYDEFKHAHALNSARILIEIMNECNINKELIDDVFFLVQHHETGCGGKTNILKDADTISFFDVNLPSYFVRNGVVETKRRCLWGYRRLSENLKKVVVSFNYEDKKVHSIIKNCIKDYH